MTTRRPTFRIMKNGYDRFAVDDVMEQYATQVAFLQRKLELYQEQMVETTEKLEDLQTRYNEIERAVDVRKDAADSITRLSLQEANDVMARAQNNADEIVKEALSVARSILLDLSQLYTEAGEVKSDLSQQLTDLQKSLDNFKLPKLPDMDWLEESDKELH
ncbi:MAG: DivIVA domain-containing protein [Solobacterium sp.]|nr:DivIVA domain-containing protein [Solobacterium sp.]